MVAGGLGLATTIHVYHGVIGDALLESAGGVGGVGVKGIPLLVTGCVGPRTFVFLPGSVPTFAAFALFSRSGH